MTIRGISRPQILKRDKLNEMITSRFQIDKKTNGGENKLYPRSHSKLCLSHSTGTFSDQGRSTIDPTSLPRPSPTFSPIVEKDLESQTSNKNSPNVTQKPKDPDFTSSECSLNQHIDSVRNTHSLDVYFPQHQNRSPWNICTSRLMNATECRPEQFIPQDPRFPCLRTHRLQ